MQLEHRKHRIEVRVLAEGKISRIRDNIPVKTWEIKRQTSVDDLSKGSAQDDEVGGRCGKRGADLQDNADHAAAPATAAEVTRHQRPQVTALPQGRVKLVRRTLKEDPYNALTDA